MANDKITHRIVFLTFSPELSSQPVVCNLPRLYDLSFNILKAQINPRQVGSMTMDIAGKAEDVREAIAFLKRYGVEVTPVEQKISRNEESCMHCGVCTALCPTRALLINHLTYEVVFNPDKCSACGICVNICPVRAFAVDLENGL